MFSKSICGITDAILEEKGIRKDLTEENINEVCVFVLGQIEKISRYYRIGIKILLFLFIVYSFVIGGEAFSSKDRESRIKYIKAWKKSNFPMSSLMVEFFEKISIFGAYSYIKL